MFGVFLLHPVSLCLAGCTGQSTSPRCVPQLPLLISPFWGVVRTPRNPFFAEGQGEAGGLGESLAERAALPVSPSLDLLLSRSLLGWASGWEQGHAIRLSAELFILGR